MRIVRWFLPHIYAGLILEGDRSFLIKLRNTESMLLRT